MTKHFLSTETVKFVFSRDLEPQWLWITVIFLTSRISYKGLKWTFTDVEAFLWDKMFKRIKFEKGWCIFQETASSSKERNRESSSKRPLHTWAVRQRVSSSKVLYNQNCRQRTAIVTPELWPLLTSVRCTSLST